MTTFRFAVIGCGGAGGFRMRPILERDDVQVTALCDVSEEVTRAYADKHLDPKRHQPRHVQELAEVFAPGDVDAVLIASPHTLHFEQAMAALDAGCHVYVEKPMVTSVEHAVQLKEAVARSGKQLTIGYNAPCSPALKRLREIIVNKELGELDLVTGYLSQDWLTRTAGSWRQKPELSGGGQLYDSGCHLLASVLWAVGRPVEEVFALIERYDAPVDITSALAIRFQGGGLASLAVVGNSPNWGKHTTFCFTGGRVDCDGWNGSWLRAYDPEQEIESIDQAEYRTPLEHFIEVLHGKEELIVSAELGLLQSELMDAIYLSEQQRAPVRPLDELKALQEH